MKSGFNLLLSLVLIITSSCARKTSSYMMENIIVNPVILAQKQIYIHFTNSTIYDEFDIESQIKKQFQEKGFTINQTPEDALVLINANIKFYGLLEDKNQNAILQNKFLNNNISKSFDDYSQKPEDNTNVKKKVDISDFLIIASGSVGGFLIFNNVGIALLSGIGLYGGGKSLNYFVKSKMYFGVIDVVISEYTQKEVESYDFRETNQGLGGIRKTEFKEKSNFKHYQTRIFIINSNGGLLDAKKQIIKSIVGVV